MPIADNNPPMVVGIKQTSKATSTVIDGGALGRKPPAEFAWSTL